MVNEIATSVTLRPVVPDDQAFLLKVYASTRPDDLKLLGDAFINMQFNIQRRAYSSSYPNACHQIILFDDEPIGRILKNESNDEFTLVDIALLPPYRKRGVGTYLIEELLEDAKAARKSVRLHVLRTNRARYLYERLGFSLREGDPYCEMVWSPPEHS
jgi:ribosomal protein S18 acetylase RimI-like enzyme